LVLPANDHDGKIHELEGGCAVEVGWGRGHCQREIPYHGCVAKGEGIERSFSARRSAKFTTKKKLKGGGKRNTRCPTVNREKQFVTMESSPALRGREKSGMVALGRGWRS